MVTLQKCTSDLGRGTAMKLAMLDLTCIMPSPNAFDLLPVQYVSADSDVRVLAGEVSVG